MTVKTVFVQRADEKNPRSSEGDFVRLPNGRILFAYSRFHGGSHDHSPSDIAGLFSDDNGKSFTPPQTLITAGEHHTENIMSVSLVTLKNGDAGIFYLVKQPDGTTDYVMRRTKDGFTFSEAKSCIPETSSQSYYVINNGRILRASTGRLIIPAALHRNSDYNLTRFDGRALVVFFYSDDDGDTWHEAPGMIFPPHAARTQTGLQEPGIIELPSGALYAYARTDLYCQYESISVDSLNSWSPAQPSPFSSPASPLSIRQNPFTGEYFAVWNPIPNYFGREIAPRTAGRTPLAMARSQNGHDFSALFVLESDPTKGFCYPSLFFPDANTLLLSYCFGGEEDDGFLNCLKIVRISI